MKINFGIPGIPSDDLVTLVNSLVVNYLTFSEIACLDGRAHGVKTSCDSCEHDINACLRDNLYRNLIASQGEMESLIGYNLTDRFHVEEVPWTGAPLLQTKWPGIESMNVRQVFTAIDGYGPFEISPYIIEDVSMTAIDSFCQATIDEDLVGNPNHVIFRNSSGEVIAQQKRHGYPRRNVDGDWEIALGNRISPPCENTVNVQHCKYMILEVEPVECEGGEVVPVYTGTNQIIPQARPAQILPGGNIRYWFYTWSLVDPAFSDDDVDLAAGEFYKLLTTVDFKCITEEIVLPEVIFDTCNCCQNEEEIDQSTDPIVTLNVLDPANGVFQVCETDRCDCWRQCACKKSIRLRYYYKTSPSKLSMYYSGLTAAQDAIAHLTAANLPLSSCGCEIKTGFIGEAQKAYTQIREGFGGVQIINLQYGQLHGQVVFKERMKLIPKFKRQIRI